MKKIKDKKKLRALLSQIDPDEVESVAVKNFEDDLSYIVKKLDNLKDSSQDVIQLRREFNDFHDRVIERMNELSSKKSLEEIKNNTVGNSQSISSLQNKISTVSESQTKVYRDLSEELQKLIKKVDAQENLKSDIESLRVQSLNRGGSIPLQVSVNSTVANSRYADINIISSGATVANNNTTKKTTITLPGGSPGGSNTQVQFNDSGSFGGDNHFIWDKTNDTLTLGTTASPITNLRLWAQGTGDLIDFGSYPSSFGVLGNDVVSGEVGLLSGNDEYIAVRNVSGNFQFGGNASGNTIGIVSRATQSSAGVGILLPVYPWHVVSSDTTRPTILISGKANGGIATVNQLEWWDNTNNVRLGALGDLGDGINGAFWIFGDSSLATYEFADFFAMDRALMSADLRTCGFTVRLNASGTGGYRNDFFIKDGAAGLSAKFAVTPDGAIVGSNTDGQNPTARLHILAGSASAGTAPLKLTSGTVLTSPEAGAIEFNTNILSYTTTTGTRRKTVWGAISARATAQTGAAASVVTYTLPATDGSFIISANVLVTTATAHNFSVTCAYTDEGNTARTFTFNMSTIGGVLGTAIINTGGAVPYEGIPVHIRCKASTAITIATTGTFTTVTYNVEGAITQIA